MKNTKTTLSISAAFLAGSVLLAGCATAGTEHTGTDHAAGTEASRQAPVEAHNSADTMFAQMMIPHHEQAVEMSEIMLDKASVSPELAKLATQIKDAQAPEISLMESWLTAWGESRTVDHGMAMDGMLGEAELDSLKSARGGQSEELFLQQMIEHHLGATKMAEEALASGKNSKVLDLSRAIITTQNAEISHMREMLKK
ncbi:DUF305 domain-containing protein [Paeniglutamicibacter quisquiliarum]|uniref:DUF305 domain-containing protein n=1 Tax=Paeniglutamicibacter quisquiliarum TaxID=2849498 RepID=UPI0020C5561A|nr:DUF305 domain-containing protein [Paeniglutamicibacter quisquiliarum]